MPRLLSFVSTAVLASAASAFVLPTSPARANSLVRAFPDATLDCYGLPGAGFGLGKESFDPAGFCKEKSLGEVKVCYITSVAPVFGHTLFRSLLAINTHHRRSS